MFLKKAIPYKYNATLIEDSREVPIPPLPYVGNIAQDSRVLRNGRVILVVPPKKASSPMFEQVQVEDSSATKEVGQSSEKVVDQLMQTPSKISLMSLLLNYEAQRGALMRVLDQAIVDHDVTVGQFGGIVGKITACDSLSFSDEKLPEEGRNHNLALHISVNCKTDALSNVLVDTGSSLHVMAKTTYDQLSYQGTPSRPSGVMVKALMVRRRPDVVNPQVHDLPM